MYELRVGGELTKMSKKVDIDRSMTPVDSYSYKSSVTPSLLVHLKWLRAFGSIPFEISEESLSKLSRTHVIYITVLLILCIVSLYIQNIVFKRSLGAESLGFALSFVRSSIGVCWTCAILTLEIIYRFKYEKIIKKLLALQRLLGNRRYPMFRSLKFFVIYLALCLIVRSGYKVALTIKTNDLLISVVTTILWNTEYVQHLGFAVSFLYHVRCTSACFAKLSKFTFVETGDVKRFIKIYTHLDDIAGDINSYFNFTIFFVLGLCLADVFYLTGVVYRGKELGLMTATIIGYFTLLIIISSAVMIIHTCQQVSDQADCCNKVLLNHLFNHATASQVNDPAILTHLSLKNGLVIKLLNSVPVNYSLGISMVAAYITYTIVLFQFYSAGKST